MRIIQVINVRWFNATVWYGLYLSRLLHEAGHEVLVLGLPGTESAAMVEKWGLPLCTLDLNTTSPWGIMRLYQELKALVRDFRPDVVNCHRGESFILWGLLKKRIGGFRLVRTRGDQRLPKNNFVNRWLHNQVADAVITTNSKMTTHFHTAFALPPTKVHQILGGVDQDVFYPDPEARDRIRNEFGYHNHDFVLGLLGRFDRVKGQKELIQAVAYLKSQGFTHVRLLLLGFSSAISQKTVQQWIVEHGLEDITRITGKRPDISSCLNALDLGVIASLWSETIARAALEIMGCGVPLVATRVGVMPDLLDDEALVPPGDVQALAQVIASVIMNKDLQTRMHRSQSQRIKSLSGQNFLEQTLAVYQQS